MCYIKMKKIHDLLHSSFAEYERMYLVTKREKEYFNLLLEIYNIVHPHFCDGDHKE